MSWKCALLTTMVVACAAEPARPEARPLAPSVSGPPSSSATSAARVADGAVPVDVLGPLIAEPRFAAVVRAEESGDPQEAARAVEAALGPAFRVADADQARSALFVARLHEAAGDPVRAEELYPAAAVLTRALTQDPAVGAARTPP